MIYLWIVLIGFFAAVVLSPVSTKLSQKLNIFSRPNKKEIPPKPCLGGMAIYIAIVSACVFACFLYPVYNSKAIGLFISSTLIILLGLVDDIKELKPATKIVVEVIAVIFLMLSGIITKIVFLPLWVNILITLIWVLLITNAFNLLDIMDGLASGLVIIICASLLVISLVNGDVFSSIILLSLIAAHSGFLIYNYPPAKLYMGDAGSLFSGFLLAILSINISYAPLERPVALLTPILAMSLPIYDTLFLIIMRIKRRRPIFSKSDDHFALRLITKNLSVRKSLWIMYSFSIFLAASSLIVAFGPNAIGISVLIIVFLVFIFMGKDISVVRVE